LLLSLTAALLVVSPTARANEPTPDGTQVVVTLEAPSLARAIKTSRVLTPAVKARRLDLRSATSRAYLADVRRAQQAVERRIQARIPSATVRWRYAVVLNGLAVALARSEVRELAGIEGVEGVHLGGRYGVTLDRSPSLIGADDLWGGPTLPTAGNGVKIGIIDDGVDQSHPFFAPAGYTYPAGFPKGQRSFTTPKVIAARAFAPATTTWQHARKPFDPVQSQHGTHVAGIAAGNVLTAPVPGRGTLSGTAPRAYIGNYKVLSTPSDFGLIDNAGEVIAGIEAAVRDGMDVINMSFGEHETDPARTVVDRAVDGAALLRRLGTRLDRFPGHGRAGDRGGGDDEVGLDRVVLVLRSYRLVAADEAGRLGARCIDSLLRPGTRGHVGVVQRHEHGLAPRRRRGCAARPASPGLDG
jgi:subtilisin family serine protease